MQPMANIKHFERALRRWDATEKRLRGAVIMGIKKCGTGALIEMLNMHPQIDMPNYHKTEVVFWADDDQFVLGLEHYKVTKRDNIQKSNEKKAGKDAHCCTRPNGNCEDTGNSDRNCEPHCNKNASGET